MVLTLTLASWARFGSVQLRSARAALHWAGKIMPDTMRQSRFFVKVIFFS
jgi:hypothetical protein